MGREIRVTDGFVAVRVAQVAERQHGVVSRRQLRAIGLGDDAIDHRARTGLLHRVHRGVYAVGHPRLTGEGRRWAAVLATDGVLSHRTAAAMWDLLPWPSGPIDVITRRRGGSVRGIHVTKSRLDEREITTLDGLPVTTPMRTLLDLALILAPFKLQRVVHRAAELHLLDASYDPAGRPGAARLRAAMATLVSAGPQRTRSPFEEDFLQFLHDHHLPQPLTNAIVNDHEVDAYWPHARLIAELDSHRHHDNPIAFEEDRAKDHDHLLAGDRVIRLTARMLTVPTAAKLRRLLDAQPRALGGNARGSGV